MRFALDPSEIPRKEHGRHLGLWDAPLYRDWLAWWGGSWVLVAGLALGFPTEPSTSSLPRWLDALLAMALVGAMFGLLPAYVRLVIRRQVRRRQARGSGTGASVERTAAVRSGRPSQPAGPAEPESTVSASTAASRSERPAGSASTDAISAFPMVPRPDQPPRIDAPASASRVANSPTVASDARKCEQEGSPAEDSAFATAREVLPYPVARAARSVQLATDPADAYRALLRCAEATSIVLGITATAWARQHGIVSKELQSLQTAYLERGVSQGHWLAVARSLERPLRQHDAAIPGMAEGLRAGKRASGLLADLGELLQERNLAAHGGDPQTRMEAAERALRMRPILARALTAASFLSKCDWIVTRSSRYRRRERDFEVTAARAMSDHPDFEVVSFIVAQPLADDVFYLLTPDGSIDLTPLVVLRQCPQCRQPEVAYADRLDARDGVSLKSFDRGHTLFDPTLVDELRRITSESGSAGVSA